MWTNRSEAQGKITPGTAAPSNALGVPDGPGIRPREMSASRSSPASHEKDDALPFEAGVEHHHLPAVKMTAASSQVCTYFDLIIDDSESCLSVSAMHPSGWTRIMTRQPTTATRRTGMGKRSSPELVILMSSILNQAH